MTKNGWSILLPGFVVSAILATPAFAAAPVVRFSGIDVTMTVTTGGSVALLVAAHEPDYYMHRVVARPLLLVDDDNDGKVSFEPPHGVAFRSIWIAIDLQTG